MRWKPEAPSIYLPDSGQIDLNAIGVEAGQSNNSQTALNDAAVRDMIGKGANAQNAMSEYYGASSSDALTGAEEFGSGYWLGMCGYKDNNPSSGLDISIRNSGNFINATPLASGEIYWPQGSDGKPHAFTGDNPAWCDTGGYWVPWNSGGKQHKWSSGTGGRLRSEKVDWELQNFRDYWSLQYGVGTSPQNSEYEWHEQWVSAPFQRLSPGKWRIEGRCKYGPAKTNGRTHQVTVYLMEREGMVDDGNFMSKVSGAKKQTALYAGPVSQTGMGAVGVDETWSKTITTTYEWCYINIFSRTNTYSTGNDLTWIYGIYPA